MSRHSFALEYTARCRTGTIGTLMTMEFRTVSHRSSMLTKSLNSALESFTFRNCSCVYMIAFCKDICFDFICKIIISCIFKLELSYKSLSRHTSFLEMSHFSFVYAMSVSDFFLTVGIFVYNFFFLVNKTNLYCTVSVVFNSFNLCYYTRTSL